MKSRNERNPGNVEPTPHETDVVVFPNAMALLDYLEALIDGLLEMKPSYAVVPIGNHQFMQVMALDDGGLRLESSLSLAVIAANMGFSELVEQHEHLAGAMIPAAWPAKERMAAETMMRLAVDVHGVQFPAKMEFRVDTADVE